MRGRICFTTLGLNKVVVADNIVTSAMYVLRCFNYKHAAVGNYLLFYIFTKTFIKSLTFHTYGILVTTGRLA